MKKFVDTILEMPKWIPMAVIACYSLLFAEFVDTLNGFVQLPNKSMISMFQTLSHIHYAVNIVSSILTWIIMTFLFHLMALLFDGNCAFSKYAIVAACPYIIPSIMILVGLFIVTNISITPAANAVSLLEQNHIFFVIRGLINYSYIPYYTFVIIFTRYLYNLKWLYAAICVLMPVLAIWGITEVIKLL